MDMTHFKPQVLKWKWPKLLGIFFFVLSPAHKPWVFASSKWHWLKGLTLTQVRKEELSVVLRLLDRLFRFYKNNAYM